MTEDLRESRVVFDSQGEAPAPRGLLVVVTGPPGSGKTTLARRLAPQLGIGLLTKDDLKVIMYDTLGWGGRKVDRATSDAAYELMFHVAQMQLAVGGALMLEANFRAPAAKRLRPLIEAHRAAVVQIWCTAPREALVERLRDRTVSRLRHPGHADDETFQDLEGLLSSGVVLDLPGPVYGVDTARESALGRVEVADHLNSLIGQLRR